MTPVERRPALRDVIAGEVRYVNNEPILRPQAEYVGPSPRDFTPPPTHGAPAG